MNSSGRNVNSVDTKGTANCSAVKRFKLEHIGKVVQLSDPRIAPDGSSIVVCISRANYDENRFDVELVQVDVASRARNTV